jgi:hypothetical protein
MPERIALLVATDWGTAHLRDRVSIDRLNDKETQTWRPPLIVNIDAPT